ncbi:uncharacterized protein LOC129908228 isoform X2 [Episyrphus balteatus]|nr:uncharacterized protein LOC129908228 isoform X2 [Episyrphus balteatus]XP_055840571.1 uncharacterized protein LOC129908228 isoform X2 [Episyrphus balteatus]
MQPVQQPPPNNWATHPIGNVFQQKQENILAPMPQQTQQTQQQNNNWTPQDFHTPSTQRQQQPALPTSGYFLNQDNFNQPQQQYPVLQPAYPPPQQYQQQNVQQAVELPLATPVAPAVPVSYSRQSTQQMDNVQEASDYFDNKSSNTNDGWGDWDWNDNNLQQHQVQQQQVQQQQVQQQQVQQQEVQQQQLQQHQEQQQQLQQSLPVATSISGNLQNNNTSIDDSFRIESNDNWQWGQTVEKTQQNNNLGSDDHHQNSQKPPLQGHGENNAPQPSTNSSESIALIPPPQPQAPNLQPALVTLPQQIIHDSAVLVKPTNLPLNDVSSLPENTQSNNNIPSPVYVSQAKPVPKPPRQFASPPGTLSDTVNSIGPTTPPHAFQNRPEHQPATISAVQIPTSNPTLPPPMISNASSSSTASNNPFKRAGLPQHHRADIVAPPVNVQASNLVAPPAPFYASPPPPPEDFANPSVENHEVIAPDNSEILHENQEIAPNNDRNEYLQTSHLSEIGGGHADAAFNIETQEQYNESDDFPPPGLSRLVLGQPENESRQVPGTEDDSSLNIERQADGEDTDPTQLRSNFASSSDNNQNNALPSQIDITADRNLYLVPGESDAHEQRVVTGLENGSSTTVALLPIQVEQRELELDGENIEDQHQPQQPQQTSQHHHSHQHRPASPVQNVRDEALDGANSLDRQVQGSQNKNQEIGSNLTQETNLKDLSNISTGNDESDQRDRHYNKTRRGIADTDNKKRRSGHEAKENRYESEESEFSSDRERRRYREGSVRSERDRERDSKERKRRDKREREAGGERDRERYRGDDRENRYREKFYRDREGKQSGRYVGGRYDVDSKYETESSTRHERRRGGDRGDRSDRVDREAYEEYRRYRKYDPREERGGHDRRGGPRVDGDRRRTDREYREERDTRRHKETREKPRIEYEEYRKASSRNARESDIEKDSRIREKDPRYAGHSMYGGYSGYGYDPYAAYYYEQMVRTNPQAYSEWYKKYYGQAPAPESITNNGRESVHSGRSSANNEKDRYTAQHHQYIPHTGDYQRHFMPPGSMAANMSSVSMNSTMNESQQQQKLQQQQRNYGLSGGPSTGNLSQINQLSGPDYYASTARSYYARSEYTESRPDNLSHNLVDAPNSSTQEDPQRLTPHKFTIDHPIVSLGPGLMVTVKPNYSQSGITNVVKIFRMGCNDATNKLFQSFPGPLIRGLTHKKTIIEFCEDQIRLGPHSAINPSRQNSTNSLSVVGQPNKPSFTLMWNLLILLLRQNGMVVGTDIAELLIKNQQQFPYESAQNSVASNSNLRESLQSDEQRKSKENTPSEPIQDEDESSADESDEQTSKTSSLSEDEITEKFRNYLLYGNVNEALEWATDKNLWGHALFLASKVDRRSHANVMMKFANKLSLNDPLQTLYQLMSGRTPSSVTSVQDEKWGDWRPHLSMILSNTSQKPELDRKAITTLGDSLFNRGDLFAAHFCYLMAQVGFSKYPEERSDTISSQNLVRLVLLGSSHQKEFEEFATNESIMMTEVYEYACSLNDDKFSLVEFQPYKLLLATRMLDYGYQLKCLMYMEQISLHIKRDPSKYEALFINQVYELADRLKYYDPVLEKSMDEIMADGEDHNNDVPFDEQPWLQELRSLAIEHTVQPNSQDINEDYQQTSNVIDQQFAEINRQFNELNLQYDNTNTLIQDQHQQLPSQTDPTQVQYIPQPDGSQISQTNEQIYPQFYNPMDGQTTHDVASEGITNVNGYMQPTQEPYQQPSIQSNYDRENNQAYTSYGQDEQQQYWSNQANIQNDELEDKSNSKSTSQSDNSDSMSSTTKTNSLYINGPQNTLTTSNHLISKSQNKLLESPKHLMVESTKLQQKQNLKSVSLVPVERNFKKLQQNDSPTIRKQNSPNTLGSGTKQKPLKQQQPYNINTDTARPTISMPNSQSQKSGSYDEDSQPGDSKQSDAKRTGNQGSSAAGPKADSKNSSKGGHSSSQNSGWFGGIWNKLSLKPKNQMILPDDKNPAIVWDPEKKKWVNTDGEEQNEESLKPPPKMSDLVPKVMQNLSVSQVQQQHQQALPHEEASQQLIQTMPTRSLDPVQTFNAAPAFVAPTLGEPTKPPSLQSNMFKMQRNRTLKNSYVDVFNPSGAPPKPTEQVLAPALPPAAVPSGGFFVPGAAPNDGGYQQQQQPTQDGAPQFYNPNQFGGYQQ